MTPEAPPRSNLCASERGFSMLLLIFILLVGAALSAGAVALIGNSQVAQVMPVQESRAYFAAKSGIEYARKTLEEDGAVKLMNLNGEHRALPAGSFTLAVASAGANSYKVTSTGSISADTTKGIHKLVAVLDAPTGGGDGGDGGPVAQAIAKMIIDSKNGDVDIKNSATLVGDVRGKSVTFHNSATITGNVYSEGAVEFKNSAAITGNICAAGNITFHNTATITGDINTLGSVTFKNSANIKGNIYAAGGITLNNSVIIDGDLHSGGSVDTKNSSTVKGSIYSSGATTVGNDASVNGSINAGGSVNIGARSVIGGSVLSGGSIVNEGAIAGSAIAIGSVTHNNGGKAAVTQAHVADLTVPAPTAPLSCYLLPAPNAADFTAYSAGANQSGSAITLPVGEYGSLSSNNSASVVLTAGKISDSKKASYYFKSMDFSNSTTLYLNMSSASEDLVIFVDGDVNLKNSFTVKVCTSGCSSPPSNYHNPFTSGLVDRSVAGRIYLETHRSVRFSNSSVWFGTMLAKENIDFDNSNIVIGSYHTINGRVLTSNSVDLTYEAPTAWPVHYWAITP